MIPRYIDALKEGGLAVNQAPKIVLDTGAMVRLDGRRGYGQVIGHDAMDDRHRAREEARPLRGRRSTTRTTSAASAIGPSRRRRGPRVDAFRQRRVAPDRGDLGRRRWPLRHQPGVHRRAARKGEPPIILDFATSRIAQGKTRVAHNKGKQA